MRNKWISLGLLAFTCASLSVFADNCNPTPKCKPKPKPKCEPEPCCKQVPVKRCRPCCPPDAKYMQDGWGLRIDASALYMKCSTPGGALGIVTTTHGGKTATGKVPELNSRMRWGLDLNVGVEFGYGQEAELAAEWLYITSDFYNNTSTVSSGLFIIPSLGDADQYTAVSSLNVKSHIVVNFFDVTIGRRYTPFHNVTFKPFMGVAGVTWRQNFNQTVNGIDVTIPTRNTAHTNIGGGGLVFGTRSDWNFGWGFSLVGVAKVSLFYDHLSNHAVNYNKTTGAVNTKSHLSFHMMSYNIDFKAGLQYKYVTCDCKQEFGFGVDWRLTYFEKFSNFGGGGRLVNNNIGFQGLEINAFVGF
jgi:hypothetical protein